MQNWFTQFISDNLPAAVTFIIICLTALIFLVWWASKMWHKLKSLPCNNHESSISKHTDKIDEVSITLGEIRGQLNILIRLLPQNFNPQKESILSVDAPVLAQKHSPKILNDNGRKIEALFGCKQFLKDNASWLIAEVEKFSPQTALDVETFSMSALRVASFDERFNNLKDKIYHSATIELALSDGQTKNVEITLDDVLFVISLPLRDLYMAAHPEIK